MSPDDRFDELLDALTRPSPRERDRPVPPEILRAFAQAAADQAPETPTVRRRRFGLAAKTVACALALSGSAAGVAAAAANDLPGPAQSVAHAIFGALGVPAPQRHTDSTPRPAHTAQPDPTPSPAATVTRIASPTPGTPSGTPTKPHPATRAHGEPPAHPTPAEGKGHAQRGKPEHCGKSRAQAGRADGV